MYSFSFFSFFSLSFPFCFYKFCFPPFYFHTFSPPHIFHIRLCMCSISTSSCAIYSYLSYFSIIWHILSFSSIATHYSPFFHKHTLLYHLKEIHFLLSFISPPPPQAQIFDFVIVIFLQFIIRKEKLFVKEIETLLIMPSLSAFHFLKE